MALLGAGMLREGVLNLCSSLCAERILRKGQMEAIGYWTQTNERQE